jgi:hypothetical protein
MGEFLGIMFAIIFFVTPKENDRVQIWPYAADTNSYWRELNVSLIRTKDGWCPGDGDTNRDRCVVISNGKWVDEHGKVVLEIKNNLKVTNGTNYVFNPKDWENPLQFSVREGQGERTFEIREKGKTIREIKVKMWKSDKSAATNGR